MLRSKWFALLFAVTLAPAAEAQDFCSQMKRVVADIPNKLQAIRGSARTHVDWDARVAMPGMTNCVVSNQIVGFDFECEVTLPTRAAADARMKEMETLIRQCYPRGQLRRATLEGGLPTIAIYDLPEFGAGGVGATMATGNRVRVWVTTMAL